MSRSDAGNPQGGVSLVELMLVVAILGILAAIAIPFLYASITAAREARAIANCRAMGSAELSFYAAEGKFGIFDDLFSRNFLGETFTRRIAGTAASEIISDSAYRYKITFTVDGDGITIDSDPEPRYQRSCRWFRLRLGRVVAGLAGGEGVMYAAPAGAYVPSPPSSAYRLLGR